MEKQSFKMSYKLNLIGCWAGIVSIALLFLGWLVIADFFPLHKPTFNAEEIALIYRNNTTGIRIGILMVVWSAFFFLAFTATMADYVSKVEGRFGPLSVITALAGFSNAMYTFYPGMWWLNSVYRIERSSELIQMMNDAGWLQFMGSYSMFIPWYLTVAIAVFHDDKKHPILPRWFAYLSLWIFVLLLPGQLLFFFHTGPFAWNGLFAFWIPAPIFGGWIVIFCYLVLKSLRAQTQLA